MGFLDRFTKKDLSTAGIPGTAVVQARKRAEVSEAGDSMFTRSAKHNIDLVVTIEGRDSYHVSGKFDVPKQFFGIAKGVSLPVRVDAEDPNRLQIDWDAFEAAGGRQSVDKLGDQYRRDAVTEMQSERMRKNPELQEQERRTVQSWLGAVKAGNMAVQDFNGYVDEKVAMGFLPAEEGSAAKAEAAGTRE